MTTIAVVEKTMDHRRSSRRLNMDHGFMKFIQRNQIDRDEFNKMHEKRKTDIKEKLSKNEQSKNAVQDPKIRLYVPPALRKQNCSDPDFSSSSSSSCSSNGFDHSNKIKNQRINTRPNSTVFDVDEEKTIRENVRRRYNREVPSLDKLCGSFANFGVNENENEKKNDDDDEDDDACIFTLKLTLKDGQCVSIDIQRRTQAARMAKILSREHNFDDDQCRELRKFIDEQINKRLLPVEQVNDEVDLDTQKNPL